MEDKQPKKTPWWAIVGACCLAAVLIGQLGFQIGRYVFPASETDAMAIREEAFASGYLEGWHDGFDSGLARVQNISDSPVFGISPAVVSVTSDDLYDVEFGITVLNLSNTMLNFKFEPVRPAWSGSGSYQRGDLSWVHCPVVSGFYGPSRTTFIHHLDIPYYVKDGVYLLGVRISLANPPSGQVDIGYEVRIFVTVDRDGYLDWDKISKPQLGEVVLGPDIGKKTHERHIWAACGGCGKQRWVLLRGEKRNPKHLCQQCGLVATAQRRMAQRYEQEAWWDGVSAPQLGQLARADVIGRKGHYAVYHRVSCMGCGTHRWVRWQTTRQPAEKCRACSTEEKVLRTYELAGYHRWDGVSTPREGDLTYRACGKTQRSIRTFRWALCVDCGEGRWVGFYPRGGVVARCQRCAVRFRKQQVVRSATVMPTGYYRVRLDKDDFFYPMTNTIGSIYVHRLVMAKQLNRCLLPWEIVHHRNGNKGDNRPENLEVVTAAKYHLIDTQVKAYVRRLEAANTELRETVQWLLGVCCNATTIGIGQQTEMSEGGNNGEDKSENEALCRLAIHRVHPSGSSRAIMD